MFSLEELFCHVDDFCQTFEPLWQRQLLGQGLQQRKRKRNLCLSEIMTIVVPSARQGRVAFTYNAIAPSRTITFAMSKATGVRRFPDWLATHAL